MNRLEDGQMTIAGPCAAESRSQVLESAARANERGINIVRASLWKPRTRPGFDGVGTEGIEWLGELAQLGLVPATEVLTVANAEQVINGISGMLGKPNVIWIGSRNQCHVTQRDIGSLVKGEKNTKLLIKNQPWESEDHWLGIIDHVVSGGADPSQIILCHRGFAPSKNDPNPTGLRNIPDLDMAMQVKLKTRLPMLIDPSHMGGERSKVLEVARLAQNYRHDGIGFDGLMIEVHPNPDEAITDSKQQLSWEQLDQILETVIYQS